MTCIYIDQRNKIFENEKKTTLQYEFPVVQALEAILATLPEPTMHELTSVLQPS